MNKILLVVAVVSLSVCAVVVKAADTQRKTDLNRMKVLYTAWTDKNITAPEKDELLYTLVGHYLADHPQ